MADRDQQLERRVERLEGRIQILLSMLRKTMIEQLGIVEDAAQMERTIKPRKDRRRSSQ